MSDDPLDYLQVFTNLPAACLVLDRDLRIVAATDAYLATVERTFEELNGEYVFTAFPEKPDRFEMFRDAFQRAFEGEANEVVEVPFSIRVKSPSGQDTIREFWWTCRHVPLRGPDGSVTHVIQNAQDVTRHVKTERLKETIAAELQHRVGNILGLVSVIARRTAEASDDLEDFVRRFDGRVRALAQTHSYLTGKNWDSMTIETILSRQLADHFELDGDRIVMKGTDVELNATEAQIFTLAIHELTTNSLKYGALKTPDGRLAINWNRVGPSGYNLEWREGGIRIGEKPERNGFGSLILDQIVPRQLQGEAVREFGDESFLYRLSVAQRMAVD